LVEKFLPCYGLCGPDSKYELEELRLRLRHDPTDVASTTALLTAAPPTAAPTTPPPTAEHTAAAHTTAPTTAPPTALPTAAPPTAEPTSSGSCARLLVSLPVSSSAATAPTTGPSSLEDRQGATGSVPLADDDAAKQASPMLQDVMPETTSAANWELPTISFGETLALSSHTAESLLECTERMEVVWPRVLTVC
jgi:hypothetical protein